MGVEDFEALELTEKDLVIFPYYVQSWDLFKEDRLWEKTSKSHCKTALIVIGCNLGMKPATLKSFSASVIVNLPFLDYYQNLRVFVEFSSKLVFNAITTGGCVQKGLVSQNVMINLNVRYHIF